MRALVLLALCAGCQSILGIDDTKLAPDAGHDAPPAVKVDVGRGKDGPLVVASTVYTDDVRTNLARDVGAGSTLLHVVTTDGFAIDDEVLVIQMTGEGAGRSDTGIVRATTATTLMIDRGLANTYGEADITQVIRVPQFTDVTVPEGARLTAHAWDGATGGVVFFRASGTVKVATGGTIDAIGGAGGDAGTSAAATAGGLKGFAGARANCPLTGCGTATNAGVGTPGEFGFFGAVGEQGASNNMCSGGRGGRGGMRGQEPAEPGVHGGGGGPGAALDASAGGAYLSTSSSQPMIGGGGAGGTGARGGRGAGGGGGGGGALANSGTGGANGTDGGPGGEPGQSGAGGHGGGIVWIHANAIEIDGTISARGADGGAGTNGIDGGAGGDGGEGGSAFSTCPSNSGAQLRGGMGGPGEGGDGGGGGNGGGGGAGGTVLIESFTVRAGGMLLARGGAGNAATLGGMGGPAGTGFGTAVAGDPGAPGAAGQPGADGRIYIFYVDACTSCDMTGEPTASVMAR